MRSKRFLGLFAFLLLTLSVCGLGVEGIANSAEMVLTKDKASLAPIILPKEPTYFTKIAANDLADCIGKASGVKPEIIEGAPEPVPPHAIWVGFQPKLKEIFPGTDFDFKNPEEILIKCDGKNLAIVGRDVWDPEHSFVKGGATEEERAKGKTFFMFANRDVEGYQSEYGTVNAVYTFLQDYLGVRWLWAGPLGEVVPKKDSISLKPFEKRYFPVLRQRQSIFAKITIFRQDGAPGMPGGDWSRRQRVQLDSLYAPAAGHGFGDWYDRFSKTHPEYFAMQSDGTRTWKDKPANAKICESNPAVWNQWIKDVEESVAQYPDRNIFNAAANDGYAMGICCCEECRKWDVPTAEKRIWNYKKGKPIEGVALSDRQVKFANILAQKLKERFPDKDYKVLIHAYGYSRPAPLREKPGENVVISNVSNFFSDPNSIDTSSPRQTKMIEEFDAWLALTKNQIWRPNTSNPANWVTGGPLNLTGTKTEFKRVVNSGILGISIDQVPNWWSTQGPQYYIMAQLAWDPKKDPDQILDEFCSSGFGPAADEIKSYLNMMDKARQDMVKDKKEWAEVFSDAFFAEADSVMQKATDKAKDNPEILSRIGFIRAGLEYLRINTANQAFAKKLINSDGDSGNIREAMRANWVKLENLSKQYPEAFPPKEVLKGKAANLAYIHPDADHKDLEEKRLAKEKNKKRQAKKVIDEGLE